MNNIDVNEIKIGTQGITNEKGRNSNVSSIELYVTNDKKTK
jgi:DNA-binding protein Alba